MDNGVLVDCELTAIGLGDKFFGDDHIQPVVQEIKSESEVFSVTLSNPVHKSCILHNFYCP